MDSSGEQLHPNWRALATCHINVKRFVAAGTQLTEEADKCVAEAKQKLENSNNGEEMQKFYEEVIQMQAMEKQQNQNISQTISVAEEVVIQKLPFNAQKLFAAAMSNDVQTIEQMELQANDINAKDEYGWTALMMSACAGALRAVACLLRLGADELLKDKSGKTAEQLALKKGYMQVVYMLQNYHSLLIEEEEEADKLNEQIEPFYCDICQKEFRQTSKIAHMTSTLHKFCHKTELPANPLHKFNITPRNRGLQLMLKQGWDCASGLGPSASGRLYPIKTVLRKERTGLGVQQTPARVTHFEAFDLRATKSKKYVKPRNRHDMKREKQREWKKERRLRNQLR